MKQATKTTAFVLSLLTGICLIYIGAHFLLSPQESEWQFGIHVSTSDASFHYIKGIRDLCYGLILCVLLFTREYRGLGWVLLLAVIIPAVDFSIVYMHPDHIPARLIAHAVAVVLCLLLGPYYLLTTSKTK
ncbi:DUF4267 domain-containing protein [Chitinophaga vietnamensis]|uniref:DUF4267 domain-containing protein n=1 Tax=Chitinophaga vietnamensis TaxID=2593957 RepID=UPI001177AA32|nr:DUF4267 domain-containing protein [Chitinophaga vietnamensis]